jgi:hypothetical protein
MITYTWEIKKIFSKDELIIGVQYKLLGNDQSSIIETEGTYLFNDPVLNVPFLEVTEEMVIDWIEKETIINGQSHIKSGIEKQFNELKNIEVVAPWLPQVFTPN